MKKIIVHFIYFFICEYIFKKNGKNGKNEIFSGKNGKNEIFNFFFD